MLDDRRQRYRERRGNLAHRQGVRPRQALQDRSPRWIGERPKGAIECTAPIVNHVVKYRRTMRRVKQRPRASHTIEKSCKSAWDGSRKTRAKPAVAPYAPGGRTWARPGSRMTGAPDQVTLSPTQRVSKHKGSPTWRRKARSRSSPAEAAASAGHPPSHCKLTAGMW